ncbi:MAG: glycosyltransferase, partial [Nitrospirae bacterium]|nr:glycosyltransferase [Nitrospirota bacterium]
RGSLRHWCLQSGSRFKRTWLKLFIGPFADRIYWHATSQQEADEIRAIYKDSRIFCIPNGVDIKEFKDFSLLTSKEYMKRFVNNDMECKGIIVSMARLHKVKGFDVLIDAFKIIIDRFPEAVLLIAGQDSGERDTLLKQIKRLHLEDKVFLIGQINGRDKTDFLANADVFVLPSHNENFGIACAEALAAGTPAVASRNTPWSDIEQLNCGLWVDNTPDELSKAIMIIIESDYRKMGKMGREYIFDKFNWKNIALKFNKTFELMIH